MPCDPHVFADVPFFSLLDDAERAVLAEQVSISRYAAKQRIYKSGDPGGRAYIVISGKVKLFSVDEDKQEILIDTPSQGDFFGLASLLDATAHCTTAIALEETLVIEVERDDLAALLEKKPQAGLDLLAMVGKHFHAAQLLVQARATRNPNEEYQESETVGDRLADRVARFGGSWAFISTFGVLLVSYTTANVLLSDRAWDPYPFILLNLFLSMLAAVQAPIIMMSQNRQDAKDRLRSELDYRVNLKAELEISSLLGKMERVEDRLEGIERKVN